MVYSIRLIDINFPFKEKKKGMSAQIQVSREKERIDLKHRFLRTTCPETEMRLNSETFASCITSQKCLSTSLVRKGVRILVGMFSLQNQVISLVAVIKC